MDRWEGTFPSEDAARAWAAIDALARQLVADGTCARIERARAKALTDLVAGNATIETIVTLTVPAPTTDPVDHARIALRPGCVRLAGSVPRRFDPGRRRRWGGGRLRPARSRTPDRFDPQRVGAQRADAQRAGAQRVGAQRVGARSLWFAG